MCGDQNIPKFYVYDVLALCTSSHREEWNMQCMETTYHSPTYPTHSHIHPHTHSHEGKLICDGPTKIKGRLIFFFLFSGAADEARIEYPPPFLSTAQQLFFRSFILSFPFVFSPPPSSRTLKIIHRRGIAYSLIFLFFLLFCESR